MNKLKDSRIDGFLERVERQIYTENSANDIKEELTDHIECLMADYKASGIKEENIVSKALLQMGDPQEIGYAFTDYEGMKKRKNLMLFFKISSVLMLFITFLPSFVTSNGGLSFSFDFSESALVFPNFINIWLVIASGSLTLGHSTKFLEIDSTPFAIIWPVKVM